MHFVFGKINGGGLKHNSLYLELVLPSDGWQSLIWKWSFINLWLIKFYLKNLYFGEIVSVQTPKLIHTYLTLKNNIFVCKHLARFSTRLWSLKSVGCPKLVIEIKGQFVGQKLMLSSSFRCYPIYNCQRYDFGHALLCFLSWT